MLLSVISSVQVLSVLNISNSNEVLLVTRDASSMFKQTSIGSDDTSYSDLKQTPGADDILARRRPSHNKTTRCTLT